MVMVASISPSHQVSVCLALSSYNILEEYLLCQIYEGEGKYITQTVSLVFIIRNILTKYNTMGIGLESPRTTMFYIVL